MVIKKTLLALIFGTFVVSGVEAGLITRTYTYTSGTALDPNQNNTNENTLYTEINGNITTANITDGTIQNGDVGDTQIAVTKFASTVQSSFTYLNRLGAYRRPVMQWGTADILDVEANTGTANETCVQFPDERRCVTENTASTSVNRRFIITEAASNSGTKNSGLRTGYVQTNNTWYSFYAWKVSDNATDFIIVADTVTPVQANYSALNTFYGTNAWAYLGVYPNGDGTTGTDMPTFYQAGNTVCFLNSNTGNGGIGNGLKMADTAGATTLTYTPSVGIDLATAKTPGQITLVSYVTAMAAGTAYQITNAASTINFANSGTFTSHLQVVDISLKPLSAGLKNTPSGSTGQSIFMSCYVDGVLGVGFNPQL